MLYPIYELTNSTRFELRYVLLDINWSQRHNRGLKDGNIKEHGAHQGKRCRSGAKDEAIGEA